MSHKDWIQTTRNACSQWAETFSLLAAEARPAEAMSERQVAEWASFVTSELGFAGQRRLFALRDETTRNTIGRVMQGLADLHRRLLSASKAGDGSETSQVMLSIDSALQRIASGMSQVRDEDVDEGAALPDHEPPSRSLGDDEVTPPNRPGPHLQEGSGGRRRPPRPEGTPQPRSRPEGTPQPRSRPEGTPQPRSRPEGAPRSTPRSRPDSTPQPRAAGGDPPRFRSVSTAEDAVIPLTQKKGDSTLAPLPTDLASSGREGSDPRVRRGAAAPASREPPTGEAAAGAFPGEGAPSGAMRAAPSERPARGPLRPAATDPRMALLRTYVQRLDREVLGGEEDSALEQVVAILGGALASDEDTLARRFRYLDQQYAGDDASLFSEPLMRDLTSLLTGLTERAVRRLRHACELAQADRLLFVVGDVSCARSPEWLPVVALAATPHGLREGLLPSYLARLRGPSAGFTFNVGTREGAALVRRVPENRLEFGFIAGPTRLWLTAFHVHRSGLSGALNIEPGGDDQPAYFEARLALPATEETFQVAARFVLAEAARFVDRVATA